MTTSGASANGEIASDKNNHKRCLCAYEFGEDGHSFGQGCNHGGRLLAVTKTRLDWIAIVSGHAPGSGPHDQLADLAKSCSLYVGIVHFPESAISSINKRVNLKKNAVPNKEPGPKCGSEMKGPTVAVKTRGVRQYCPCTEGTEVCGEDIRGTGGSLFAVYPPKGTTPMLWYRNIIVGQSDRKAAADSSTPVHRGHFTSDEYEATQAQYGRKRLIAKPDVVPRKRARMEVRQREMEAVAHATPLNVTLPQQRSIRASVAAELHDQGFDVSPAALTVAVAATIRAAGGLGILQNVDAAASAAVPQSPAVIGPAWLVQSMTEDDEWCMYMTGSESMAVVIARFEFLNADGVLDTMQLYRPRRSSAAEPNAAPATDDGGGGSSSSSSDEDNSGGATSASRRRCGMNWKLTPYHRWIFYLVACRRLRGNGNLGVCARIFGLTVRTAHRYYESMTMVVGRMFEGLMHPASRSQARMGVPARTIAKLGLEGTEAGYVGDATERWTEDPSSGALHSALYSEYKSHTTLKYLVIMTMDSYISHMPPPFCGGCTDNGAHIIADIPGVL